MTGALFKGLLIFSLLIGFATLALLVGLGFIFNGVAMCILGWGMHRAHRDATALP